MPRALIVGGSMAGLCAGLFLKQRGWSVDIYERSSEQLTSRGAGIVSHPELLALLSDAGARTGWLLLAGIVLFSGSLYILAITGARWLGADSSPKRVRDGSPLPRPRLPITWS